MSVYQFVQSHTVPGSNFSFLFLLQLRTNNYSFGSLRKIQPAPSLTARMIKLINEISLTFRPVQAFVGGATSTRSLSNYAL